MLLTCHPLLQRPVGLVVLGELDPVVRCQSLLDPSERLLQRGEIGKSVILGAHKVGVVEDLVLRIEVLLRTGRHGGQTLVLKNLFLMINFLSQSKDWGA